MLRVTHSGGGVVSPGHAGGRLALSDRAYLCGTVAAGDILSGTGTDIDGEGISFQCLLNIYFCVLFRR